jgi:hypothetical protein
MTAPSDTSVDADLAAVVDLARAAAEHEARGEVGQHLGVTSEGEGVATHRFAATLAGYRGWHWAVVVSRAPGFEPTVSEVVLLPGQSALRPKEWVPWSERLQAGDLGPGDLLPTAPDDARLIPGYTLSDDPAVEAVAFELGLGRVRVLSRAGRLDAAERWLAGPGGPDTPMAKQAPGHCGTCGFFVSIAGSLQAAFGVCANEYSGNDGQVVAVEYGCGAHSEAVKPPEPEELGEVYDDSEIEIVDLSGVPAQDEIAQPAVDAELAPVDGTDRDDTGGAEAHDEVPIEQLVEPDGPQVDEPAAVTGSVEEAPASDAGQDLVVEGMSGDDAEPVDVSLQDSDVAPAALEGDTVAYE